MSRTTDLGKKFYERPTELVAKELLGQELIRRVTVDGSKLDIGGVIVETEAYGSPGEDEASHAFRGQTDRNKVMFGAVGHAYVYFTYGNHFCVNVTARHSSKVAGAILIRSIQPTIGIELMQRFRKKELLALTSGPGKLTQALDISLEMNGIDLTNANSILRIRRGRGSVTNVCCTPRIGISRGVEKRWRFVDASSQFLSRNLPRAFYESI